MSEEKFVYVTYINTTPEKLWEALTNVEFMKKYWFGSNFEIDWKVGSKIREIRQDGSFGFQGKILKFVPPRILAFTFQSELKSEVIPQITFELHPRGSTVKLVLIQEGFESDKKDFDYQSTSEGWAAVLSNLKTLLETGKPLEIGE